MSDQISLILAPDLREKIAIFLAGKQWPLTPEQFAALAAARVLYDLGFFETSHAAYTAAGCPRMAWLAMGLPLKDMLDQLGHETSLYLDSMGESE